MRVRNLVFQVWKLQQTFSCLSLPDVREGGLFFFFFHISFNIDGMELLHKDQGEGKRGIPDPSLELSPLEARPRQNVSFSFVFSPLLSTRP